MYPIYRYMDSYPQACYPHRDQASCPYPQHVYPSCETPFNGASRCFGLRDCNGCWNHAYPPAPFSPYPAPQPPQHNFHGAYPPFPNTCSSHYIPHPQYLVDQGRSHCCGCPKHSCQTKDDGGMNIEEENSRIESKNNSSTSMTQWPAYPSPVVCFPPDHMKDHDHKASHLKDNGSSPMIQWPTHPYPLLWFSPEYMKDNYCKASEPQEHAPSDRWIPLEKNSFKSLKENEENKIQNQQNGAKRIQLPLPIIWMPNYDQSQESEENVMDADASPRVVEELPPKFQIIPVNLIENGHCDEKPGEEDANPGNQICPTLPDKGSRPRNIPVKHMEEHGLKKLDHPENQGDYGVEKLNTPEKQKEDNQGKRTSDSGTKKQPSPGRSSKLPPVCLRVDPLPRKKTGNGSARSPSPPGNKKVKDNHENKESKIAGSSGLKESMKDATIDKEIRVVRVERANGKHQEEGTKDMNRLVEVEDRSTSKKEGEEKNQNKLGAASTENHEGMGIDVVAGRGKSGDMAKGVEDGKHGQLKSREEVSLGHFENEIDDSKKNIEESDGMKMKENTGRKCKLSETEAVIHIQATYRGYQVRRWEPLKKLKQIAIIQSRVSSIQQQIHSLVEVSYEKGQLDEKQKLFIGETIMNLLLQLDTIQGLHPSVREIRKSVARDLVSLQEKLDTLSSKVARGLVHTEAGGTPTVGDSKNDHEDVRSNDTSDLKKSFPRGEHAQPSTESNLEYAATDKQERAGELLLGVCVGQNPSTNTKELLIETRDEQTLDPETGLIWRSEFEKEEPCCSETEGYTKPPTASEVRVDSMATDVSELPARERNYRIEEKAPELQQGMQDDRGEDMGKDDSPADDKAEAEEFHEMQAKEVKQPVVNAQAFSSASPVMLEQGEIAFQNEEVVPVVEDLMNIQKHEPVLSSESSESSQQYEDSASRNEALIMQNGETRQGELVDEPLENYCAEVDDAVSTVLPCLESSIRGVDVEVNGSENVTGGVYELKELSGYEPVNPEIAAIEGDAENPEVDVLDAQMPACPELAGKGDGENSGVDILDSPAPTYPEVADKEGDAEQPKMETMDAPVPAQPEIADGEGDAEHLETEIIDARVPGLPASSAGVDLAEDDNNHGMPALPVEENATEEEENEPESELPGMKGLHMLQAGSTNGECSTEPTSPTRGSVDFQVAETEQTSVVGTEHERKLTEENEKLTGMLEKLLEAGNKQLEMISSLSGRVKDLERKVTRRRKLKMKQHRASKSSSCDNVASKAAVESAARVTTIS